MRAKVWKNLIFLCVAAGWMYGLLRFAYHKPVVRLKPGITSPLPAIPPPSLGQSGMPPCWLFPVSPSEDKPVLSSTVGDCPPLIPGQGRLDLVEVNLAMGSFFHIATDLSLPARPPIAFTRVSRPIDDWTRRWQFWLWHLYDVFPTGDVFPYTYLELNVPGDRDFKFERISQGTGYADALYRHNTTRAALYGSEIGWNGNSWDMRLSNGLQLVFPDGYSAKRPQHAALVGLRDPSGDLLRLTRDPEGNLRKVVSQDGQWLELYYDADRISAIKDSRGELVQYSYDDLNRLTSVITPNGARVSYTYDDVNRVTAIHKNDELLLRNEYGSDGRVAKLTLADGQSYRFIYVLGDEGEPPRVKIVDSRGRSVEVRFHGPYYEVIDLATSGRRQSPLKQRPPGNESQRDSSLRSWESGGRHRSANTGLRSE